VGPAQANVFGMHTSRAAALIPCPVTLLSYELLAGKMKFWPRLFALVFVYIFLFLWTVPYFARCFTPVLNDDDPRGLIINTVALWYWLPTFVTYNTVLEVLFLRAVWRLRSVKSTKAARVNVLAFKTMVRTLTSSLSKPNLTSRGPGHHSLHRSSRTGRRGVQRLY
jgi:hypothetical protein